MESAKQSEAGWQGAESEAEEAFQGGQGGLLVLRTAVKEEETSSAALQPGPALLPADAELPNAASLPLEADAARVGLSEEPSGPQAAEALGVLPGWHLKQARTLSAGRYLNATQIPCRALKCAKTPIYLWHGGI